MSSDWISTTLGEFAPFKYGKGLPERVRVPGEVAVFSSAGHIGSHSTPLVEGAGIIIGRKGTVGSVYYAASSFWPIDTTFFVTDEPSQRDLRYTYYLLTTLGLDKLNTDSAVPGLNRENAHSRPIKVPSFNEQIAIANTLQALDDRITLLRETNKTLEAIAQAIFKSWFVDFDPVKAKMDGRQPAGMDEETAALFPDELVESELGLIPKGWEVKPVGDVVTTVGGGTPDTKNTDYWMPAMHSWTSPKDLAGISSPVLVSTARSISDKGLARISSGLLPKGTLLLSSRAPIGYLAIADLPVAINQGYIAMTPASGSLSPVYMLHWCKANMEVIKGQANGSTFMEISKTTFRRLPIILPPKRIADSFSALAQQLLTRITLNVRQADHLADLRDTLLPRLISGKLRVPIDEAETSEV